MMSAGLLMYHHYCNNSNNNNNQRCGPEACDKAVNFKAALQTSDEGHMLQLTKQNTHTHRQSWSSLDVELISALLSQGVFLDGGRGKAEETGRRERRVEASRGGG